MLNLFTFGIFERQIRRPQRYLPPAAVWRGCTRQRFHFGRSLNQFHITLSRQLNAVRVHRNVVQFRRIQRRRISWLHLSIAAASESRPLAPSSPSSSSSSSSSCCPVSSSSSSSVSSAPGFRAMSEHENASSSASRERAVYSLLTGVVLVLVLLCFLCTGGDAPSIHHVPRKCNYATYKYRVEGFGFRVSGFEFRVSGFGFRVSGFGFRVQGSGFRV
jgi:hypothetical protein